MSTDPADLGTLEGGDGGDPGTPTPPADDPRDAQIAQLKQENAKLREDKRGERARALGAELHEVDRRQRESEQDGQGAGEQRGGG